VKRSQAGLTLIEVMIALAIMAMMMALAWTTIRNTQEARTSIEGFEERNHELRAAMSRVVSDFECAYLSRNEDMTQAHPRTMMIVKPEEPIPSVRFSTLCHRVLWADAKESEQTVIEYLPFADKDNGKRLEGVESVAKADDKPEVKKPEAQTFDHGEEMPVPEAQTGSAANAGSDDDDSQSDAGE
jgi:prepilin-type N-terminal cleavage/methylation domain-containing protein